MFHPEVSRGIRTTRSEVAQPEGSRRSGEMNWNRTLNTKGHFVWPFVLKNGGIQTYIGAQPCIPVVRTAPTKMAPAIAAAIHHAMP